MSTSPVPFLRIKGLRLEAAGNAVPLVHDLSLDVRAGEFVAIVGGSGSGKTLSMRAIVGLLPPGVKRTAGSIRLDESELTTLSPGAMRRLRGAAVGLVFQEPLTSLNPAMTIGRQLDEALRIHRTMDAKARRKACLTMLERVRMANPERCLASYPHEFSGGMRQRIMLASVMLPAPRLLIADEPTTALDTLSQREVMELMTEIAAERGMTVILITHDLSLVGRYAQRVIVMEKGCLVEQGPVERILQAPSQPYTRRLIEALPRRAQQRTVMRPAHNLITVDRLTVLHRRRGERERFAALDRVSLTIAPGETVAVVGGSGSGKTTLGRALLGLVEPVSGTISFDGIDPAASDSRKREAFRRATQLIFQDPYSSLDPRMRVEAIVAEPLRRCLELTEAGRVRRTTEMLAEVGLDALAGRFPNQLSGGQRQRVAIARALITRPSFVVADEPVSALDTTIQAQVLELFARLRDQHGFACLFISHDLAVVEQIADRVIVMHAGCIVEQGSRDAIFDAPQQPFTRELLAATPLLDILE